MRDGRDISAEDVVTKEQGAAGIIIMITTAPLISFQPLKQTFDDNSHRCRDIASDYYHLAILWLG
ncbi:hypothetical protein ACET8S_05605 [Aeromonas veronii]|uniref:hypothetical protein n=1 Tax=Aeromonas TaxID=642 RepID=UPI0012E9AA32|nr:MULTISPECIES: hypothetical protein [Aeromonas]MCF5849777.1 hypothetical protein [Aeromonas veronii]